MTVYKLLLRLIWHALAGRGGWRCYVVIEDPESVDSCDQIIVNDVPSDRRGRFVAFGAVAEEATRAETR